MIKVCGLTQSLEEMLVVRPSVICKDNVSLIEMLLSYKDVFQSLLLPSMTELSLISMLEQSVISIMEKQPWQLLSPNIYLIKDLQNSRIIMISIKLQKRKLEELLSMLQPLNTKQKVSIMVMLTAQVTQITLKTWLLEPPEWMVVF